MKALFFLFLLLFFACRLQAQIITTIAGNGNSGYTGDGGNAVAAELNNPLAVTVDTVGNVFIVDYQNNRIRKIDINGNIITIAGNGTIGFSGDAGTATAAEFKHAWAVALDANGNIYIVDEKNYRIRKIDLTGIITTIAGGGTEDPGDGGPATSAQFIDPVAIAIDKDGNIYIADYARNNIRKIDKKGIITTFAGTKNDRYSGDGGLAVNADVGEPTGVAVNVSGEVFITEAGYDRVRKVDKTGIITTVAGNGQHGHTGDGGQAVDGTLFYPYGVAVDNIGNLFIADEGNNVVREVTTDGIITTVAGNGTPGYAGDGGPATSAELNMIGTVYVDKNENLFIADYANNRIRKVTGIALPVTLISFTAELNKNNALLHWQTASEENSKFFNIMRSYDAINYIKAGVVQAAGNATVEQLYTFTDLNILKPSPGQIFYKLQCVNKDGSSSFSKTVTLNFTTEPFSVFAWPNPVKNLLYINIKNNLTRITLSISDITGRQIYSINQMQGSNTITFKTDRLKPGIYIISAIMDGKKYKQKFIKE